MRSIRTDAPDERLVGDIVAALRDMLYEPALHITPETRLAELGLDSLDLLELGLELEASLGRELRAERFGPVVTVRDLAQCFTERSEPQRLHAA